MKLRQLGQDGPLVSAVGYGAMSFTDFYGPADNCSSAKVLDACLEKGISHLDTADVYGMGRSETIIGDWLKARGGTCPFTIATKVGITRDPKHRFDNSRAHMTQSLNASLKRLNVDVIDLYYVHRRDTRVEIEDVTEVLAGFVKEGKVRAIGYSEIAPSSLKRANAVHPIAAVQSEYSLSTRSPEMGLLQTCKDIGATLVAFSPVGRALLTDRPHTRKSAEKLKFLANNPRFMEPHITENLKYNAKFRALASDLNIPAATLAISWVLRQAENIVAIPGTRKIKHLEELARGGEYELSTEAITMINDILPIGWAHGDRYSSSQWIGPERYC